MYNKKKLIIGITGIRSEYDIMSSVYEEINKRESLDLKLIVTGAHLSKKYGETINEIKKDGYEIISIINSLQEENNLGSRVVGLGIQLQKIAIDLNNLQPDFLIVLGDREESMTAGLLAAYMNIPLIHIGGGDRVIGNVDDQVRHAVTKLAHIHCVTNEESKKRVLRLGEQPFRVFNFGNPGLDRIVKTPNVQLNEIQELENFINYENEPYILLIQHAISSETEKSKLQMKITLEAVKEMKIKTIVIYPNSDIGSEKIIDVIKEYDKIDFIKSIKNIPRLNFVNILRNTSCLLGNSSCGILEAPLLKIPVINIGNRQKGRLHSENVKFVDHNKQQIKDALSQAVYDKDYIRDIQSCTNPYGDGNSSEKIVNLIDSLIINDNLLIKDITY
tara:strand:+ start:319 stop:1485 length:1167 start_codon:yes stop_codon:yes gene_type:complete